PPPQPPLQLLARRRQDKDAGRLRKFLLHLLRALHVDVENQIVPPRKRLAQKAARGSVIVAKDLGVLQKLLLADHLLELLAGNEKILLATLFAAARRARRIADGELEVRHNFSQLRRQR